jgi:hypothetical protein
LIDGRPSFLIALSNPPPVGATTPTGTDGLDQVVSAGVNMFRVGPAWSRWTAAEIARVREWDAAAAVRGVHTWVNLNAFARAEPHWRAAARLAWVVRSLLNGPSSRGIGLWKGADEPWVRRIMTASLTFAYCQVTGVAIRAGAPGSSRSIATTSG